MFLGLELLVKQILHLNWYNDFNKWASMREKKTWGGVDTLNVSCYVGLDPASSIYPQNISGISDIPQKYLKF